MAEQFQWLQLVSPERSRPLIEGSDRKAYQLGDEMVTFCL